MDFFFRRLRHCRGPGHWRRWRGWTLGLHTQRVEDLGRAHDLALMKPRHCWFSAKGRLQRLFYHQRLWQRLWLKSECSIGCLRHLGHGVKNVVSAELFLDLRNLRLGDGFYALRRVVGVVGEY